ncbi:MAG TPA: hypothetical protein VGU02_16810, partial [Gaiellaceae bacterium]|nr:hypothetical protein [Gaiellaceae bacterium]
MLTLVLATLAAPALARADGHSAAPHSGHRGVQVKGQKAQRVSPFTESASSAANIPGKLVNHGGPVMTANTVHAIYWFPSGYSLDSSWRGVVDGYLGNVAADSGTTSNVFSVTSQYNVSYDATFAGSAVDTAPFPASGCSSGLNGQPCLTEEQIFNELSAFAQSQGWPADTNAVSGSNPQPSTHPTHLFIVYLPPGVADCFDDTQGICSANSSDSYYCAYHTAWYDNTHTYVWANMPWSWSNRGCQGPKAPNGATADSAVDTTSHEYIEALTDPYLNAWYDT